MTNRNIRSRLGHSTDTRVRIPDNGTALAVTVAEIEALMAEGKKPTPLAVIELRMRRAHERVAQQS
jgi:uncharacterized OB-fold protein